MVKMNGYPDQTIHVRAVPFLSNPEGIPSWGLQPSFNSGRRPAVGSVQGLLNFFICELIHTSICSVAVPELLYDGRRADTECR